MHEETYLEGKVLGVDLIEDLAKTIQVHEETYLEGKGVGVDLLADLVKRIWVHQQSHPEGKDLIADLAKRILVLVLNFGHVIQCYNNPLAKSPSLAAVTENW